MKEIEVRNKIKEYCDKNKLTLRQLAELSGVKESTLYHKKDLRITTVCKLIAALKCRFEDLFEIIEQ